MTQEFYRALRPSEVTVEATALDPRSLRPRGPLGDVVRRGSTLTWGADDERVATGSLTLAGADRTWGDGSLVRLALSLGDWREVLGTYFVSSLSESEHGGVRTQTLSLTSRLLALSGAALGVDWAVGVGASCLATAEMMCAGEGVALARAAGARDCLHAAAARYPSTAKVIDAVREEVEAAGCTLGVTPSGDALARRSDPVASRPVAWAFDASSGQDQMLVGAVERGWGPKAPNAATVRATGESEGEAVTATVELPSADPRSFARRGRRISAASEERGIVPFSVAHAQAMALEALRGDGATDDVRELTSWYVPVRERDAVWLRERDGAGPWEVEEVTLDLSDLTERLRLRGSTP